MRHVALPPEQAKLLGARYGVPVSTLDDLLLDAADLEPPSPPEPAADAEAGGLGTVEEEAPPSPTQAAAPALEFDGEVSDMLFDTLLFDPDREGDPSYTPPHTRLAYDKMYALVVRGLRHVLTQPAAGLGKGLVLDSLASRYLQPCDVARALLEALGMQQVVPPPPPPPEPPADAKGKKPKKGEEPPPPPPPPPPQDPLGWRGPARVHVHVVELAPSPASLAARLRAARAAAEPPPPPPAAVEELRSAGSATAGAAPAPLASVTPEVVAAAAAAAAEEAAAAAAAAAGELAGAPPSASQDDLAQRLASEAETLLSEWTARVAAPLARELAPPGPGNAVALRSVAADGPEDKVHKGVVGMTFRLGKLSTAMPPAPSDVAVRQCEGASGARRGRSCGAGRQQAPAVRPSSNAPRVRAPHQSTEPHLPVRARRARLPFPPPRAGRAPALRDADRASAPPAPAPRARAALQAVHAH